MVERSFEVDLKRRATLKASTASVWCNVRWKIKKKERASKEIEIGKIGNGKIKSDLQDRKV